MIHLEVGFDSLHLLSPFMHLTLTSLGLLQVGRMSISLLAYVTCFIASLCVIECEGGNRKRYLLCHGGENLMTGFARGEKPQSLLLLIFMI